MRVVVLMNLQMAQRATVSRYCAQQICFDKAKRIRCCALGTLGTVLAYSHMCMTCM